MTSVGQASPLHNESVLLGKAPPESGGVARSAGVVPVTKSFKKHP